MDKIKWSKEFSVGIRHIDEQHLNLVGIVNFLIEGREDGIAPEDIEKALQRMMDYAVIHFEEEETLMTKHQYPGFDGHKGFHLDFLQKANQFRERFRAGEEIDPLELIEYLRRWWVEHILMEDMQYKDFFQNAGVG